MTNKYNSLDLFVGCGGLTEGFEETGLYKLLGAVEWETAPVNTLRSRLKNKYNVIDAEKRVLQFDIQRTNDLINGWSEDSEYGSSEGLDKLISNNKIDVIIGGPPCQAFSIAGRIRDENGMKYDYRNYLFEAYIRIVKKYLPDVFLFENVPGILSARPGDGTRIIDKIKTSFENAGYSVLDDLKNALVDMSDYGVPQIRKRIIIFGVNNNTFKDKAKVIITEFYTKYLTRYKVNHKITVRDAIGDLPKIYPAKKEYQWNGRKMSHTLPEPLINAHIARFHSERDIRLFRFLAEDASSGRNLCTNIEFLKSLYTMITGRTSNVHKYHVIDWDKPSNLIPAHLYKDGLRHIHPDPEQARTITVREAARLQTFPDSFLFNSSQTESFKMIGNAVPPLFAKKMALALADLLNDYQKEN